MRKALKITFWILGSLLFLILVAVVFLLTPPGKELVRSQAESFLRKKLKTTVNIGGIDYGLPKFIELNHILFLDQAQDTLLAGEKIRVDINMLKLLSSNVDVQEIQLKGINAHIYRNAPDTNFNFTYIVNAFVTSPGGETEAKDTSGGSKLTMSVDELVLDQVRFRFDDYTGGSRFAAKVNDLRLTMNKIDPAKMLFHIDKLHVDGLDGAFMTDTSYLPPEPEEPSGPITLQLAANELDLKNVHYKQESTLDKFFMDINVSRLLGHPQKIDLQNQTIEIKDISLSPSQVRISMENAVANEVAETVDTLIEPDPVPEMKWRVLAAKMNINQLDFKYDNLSLPRQKSGMDYSHIDAKAITLDAQTIYYTTDTIAASLRHLSLKEQSGFDLQKLRTDFVYHPQGAYLKDLYLQTDKTILQDYAWVQYPSLDALSKNMNLVRLKLNVEKSIVGFRDVLLFAPQLAQQDFFRKNRNAMVRLDAQLDGSMDALNIEKFALSGLGSTEVSLSGKLYGLPDADKLRYNIRIAKLQSSRRDIDGFVPASVKQQISIPERFAATGTISGSTLAYNPDLIILTSDGNARLKGMLSMEGKTGKEKYDMTVSTQALNLGKILKNQQLGSISADIKAKGTGFDINTLNATASGVVHAATYNGYTYNRISFKGDMASKVGNVKLVSKDTNLHLDLTAHADMRGKHPAIKAIGTIDSINLYQLKFYSKDIKLRGKLDADIASLDPDYPVATIVLREPSVGTNSENYYLDSVFIVSAPSPDSGNNIRIEAQALTAQVWGHLPLTKAGAVIQEQIDKHYTFDDSTYQAQKQVVKVDTLGSYDLNIKARVNEHPVLFALVPSLKRLDSVDISGGVTPNKLVLDVNAPKVVYNTMNINGARLRVNGGDADLNYIVSLDLLAQGSTYIWNPTISGSVQKNAVTSNVSITDKDSTEKFRFAALLQRKGDDQVLQLQKGLLLNYQEWQVADGNQIVFAEPGMYIQNFAISKGNESIRISSETPVYNAPLTADISNFLLSNVTSIISTDTLIANGSLAGNVKLSQLQPSPLFTSALNISNLSILGDTIGNMSMDAASENANTINAKVGIAGFGNDIRLSGKYFMEPVNGDQFDMNLLLSPLSIKSMEGLTNYAIKNSSGTITGDLKVKGTISEPELDGQLKTNQLTTKVAMLNQSFTMPDEIITFTRGGIRFNNFEIYDSVKNKLSIDGRVITRDYQNMSLAMRINARNWQAMNSTVKDNKEFYGKLFLTTNMEVFGPVTAPNVDGSLNILKGTNMTIAIPEQEVGVQDHEGIVKFVNMKDTGRYRLTTQVEDTFRKLATVPKGSEINMNINLNEEANFSVIIDQATGDFLKVRGAADLNTTVAPDGTLGLSGQLEIKDGQYQLNYNLIKRLFRIQPGSTLTFSGDPTEAQVNVTAIYEAVVPPYDLVSRQVDEQELVYYKQRLPFEVHMSLVGELLKPEIKFDIVLPDEKSYAVGSLVGDLVQARLTELRNNPSDLNKQVFALIILNRFVAENPFESGAGRDAESIARQSASRFISEQLNKFAGGLIQGLDLTMDLATSDDYTTGERRNRTDLNIAASKKLLNDRLTLTVGNNFQLEGPQSNSTQGTSFIPGNLAADYDLSRDRKYRVRFYRRNEDMGIIDGFVVKTGASFIMTLEFNRIRQALMSEKKKEKLREERRKRREELKKAEEENNKAVTQQG
ncbi:MAG TPA: translocation/assembly module TamB domain-containing protein [Flavipsychrobacter sp.]|nr:translocation/assembly module TamB domain-containing protein [Flavipsychrobacter sp.]